MNCRVVAVVLLFAICNKMAEAAASPPCSIIDPKARTECGYPGIPRSTCLKNSSCCFDDSIDDVKWCFMAPTIDCFIDVQSYSLTDEPCVPVDGFVKVNGRAVLETGFCLPDAIKKPKKRGVTVTILEPYSCAPGEFKVFDTYDGNLTAGSDLANYLSSLPSESIVVGMTGDEPSKYLKDALPVLDAAGVPVADVKKRGNFAFVLQKGFPDKTHYVKSLTNSVPTSRLQVHVVGKTTDDVRIDLINNNDN